ncbi:hypothetical protein M3Y99_00919000 [Aphelenchoides fujianensis]|nr:hypothetical protein M3Y99_00919000 [Aphelenchoides fujianensis]
MEADAPLIFGLLDEGPAPVVMLADEPVDNERRDGEEEEDEDDFNVSWDDPMDDRQRALVDVRLERVNEWVEEARVRARRPLLTLQLLKFAQFVCSSVYFVFAAAGSLLLDGMILTKNLGIATVNKGVLPADANVKDRVSHLVRRLATLLQTKTRDNILVPAQRQLHGLADQLRKSLALVDVLRERKDRLNESVNDLWNCVQPGKLSQSVNEMWTKVETKAHEAKVNLEWALLRSIHRCSGTLNSYIGMLKEKLVQVLPEAARPRLESVANYVEQLDTNLANAKTVYDLFLMAKSKLQDVSSWASNFRVNGDATE